MFPARTLSHFSAGEPTACCRNASSTGTSTSSSARLCPSMSFQRASPAVRWSVRARSAVATTTTTLEVDARAQAYNKEMISSMQWELNPYEYHPQRGLYWHEIVPGLLCGTQPRCAADISALKEAGVSHIVNLQTDKDLQYWSVSIDDLKRRCEEVGISLIRRSARDFDPQSLRKTLPSAVSTVCHALAEGRGSVYVHCTAGLGRAPAVCIAYMYWFLDMDLDTAYAALTQIRPCGPKRDAIRGATYDLLSGSPWDQFERLGSDAWASLADEDKYALQWRVLKSGA